MLGIVLINYKNSKETIDYVRYELTKIKMPHQIVIVDNSCDTKEVEFLSILEKKSKNIQVISAKENLGYAKGNNLGAKYLFENFSVDYILFSNTDIEFKDNDVLDYLVQKLKDSPNISSCNPKIIGTLGENQSPYKYVSFMKSFVLKKLLYPILYKRIDKGLWSDTLNNATEGTYYRLSGAFLLVKAKDFYNVGMFDPNTFLFAEEAILAEKFQQKDKLSGYFPERTIVHETHGVIDNFYKSKKISKMMFESNYYYQKTYKGKSFFTYILGYISWFIFYYVYKPLFMAINKLAKTKKRNA